MLYDPQFEIVLFRPDIPHNTGAIGRTCVALGARLWLVRPLGFRVDNRYVKRAGLDYWPFLEWQVVDDWPTLCEQLDGRRFWFLSKKAHRDYTTVEYQKGDVLVFGSETDGLPRSILQGHPDQTLTIPMREEVRCLNLSVSAGIVSYEVRRQLLQHPPTVGQE